MIFYMIKNCGKLNDTHSNTTTSYFITVCNSRCIKGFDKKTSIFINIRNKWKRKEYNDYNYQSFP